MNRPTIMISKKRIFDSKGWNRYYKQGEMIDLNYSNIQTEKQLCLYIFRNFGEGKFMVLAWKKRRRGFWVFWIGEISSDGFEFQKKEYMDRDELLDLKEEYEIAKTPERKQQLYNTLNKAMKKNWNKSYGYIPYLKSSGRRGTFCYWEDD